MGRLVRPMKPKEVAEILHENERKVLAALVDRGTATTKELSREIELSKDAIEKASGWAETKGVVSFKEEVSQFFELTEEGQRYAREGLPEQNLRIMLEDGAMKISELKESFENLNIALVWVRRRGWADIDKGVIKLTPKGREIENVP